MTLASTGGRPKRKFAVDGSDLTTARIKAGMALEDVAVKLNVNRSTVSRWERGLQTPKPEDILQMMALFKSGVVDREGKTNGK
jgi:transcriptional regulator with XRE-family HTH domain